jgi:hypothetical protein
MHMIAEKADRKPPPDRALQAFFHAHRTFLMRLAISAMTVAALVWLGYEFWRLVWRQDYMGALDLRLRHDEVNRWFSGKKVYGEIVTAVYPPATYVLLWPFLGWMAFSTARWLWALTTILALAWFIHQALRESRARTSLERTFLALIPLSGYATGAAIGNGQLPVHLLPVLLASLLLLNRAEHRWRDDLAAAGLFIVALAKPSFTAPFFWLALLLPRRMRPALFIAGGYLGLTIFAVTFQHESVADMIRGFIANTQITFTDHAIGYSHSNLHSWLAYFGMLRWLAAASFLMLSALGLWTYIHRRIDVWVLIGVTALIARFSSYHGWYDDVLLFLPMIALFRISTNPGRAHTDAASAGILFGANLLFMIAPGGLYLFPRPWNTAYVAVQTLLWICMLAFLMRQARKIQLALV